MAGATELVAASAKRMGKVTGTGRAGLGKGGAAVLQQGFGLAGTAFKASIGAAIAGGAAAVGVGMKSVMAAADFEQTKVAFATLIGDAAKAEGVENKGTLGAAGIFPVRDFQFKNRRKALLFMVLQPGAGCRD